MNVYRTNGEVSGYCWPSRETCNYRSDYVTKHKLGKPSTCTTQPTAHCLQVVNPKTMNRQTVCARTSENCEIRRQYLIENPLVETHEVTPCVHALNTDTFSIEQSARMFVAVP